jgi:hypothetical protein
VKGGKKDDPKNAPVAVTIADPELEFKNKYILVEKDFKQGQKKGSGVGGKKKTGEKKVETEEEKKKRKLNDILRKYRLVLPDEHSISVKIQLN